MATKLALSNLRHEPIRTVLAVGWAAFAVLLMFLQLGFLGSVQATASLVYDRLEFDLLLRSPDYLHLCDARTIERGRLIEAASLPEVAEVAPFQVMISNWLNPEMSEPAPRAVMVLGLDPLRPSLDVPEVLAQLDGLSSPELVLIDRKTKWDFGPRDGRRFGDLDRGLVAEVGDRQVRIAGHFELGTGLAANGAVLTTERGFARLAPYDANALVSLGLVRLRPGVDPQDAARRLGAALGPGVEVATRAEVLRQETRRWVFGTPIGAIFVTGVALSFLVGSAIVYMVLSSEVASRLSEYATLIAMGYTYKFLERVVLLQGLLLTLLAFGPAWLGAEGMYRLTGKFANIPIAMNSGRLALVLGLSIGMALTSGMFAMRKLRKKPPADLF